MGQKSVCLNLFTVLQLNTSQPLKSNSPFLALKSLVNSTVKFRDRLQKSNPLAFKSLYEVSNRDAKGKVTTVKADRTILQRLVTAFQAGRKVDLHYVLQHELMNIHISIANCDGSLRTGSKAVLANVITRDGVCPAEVKVDQSKSCLIIDGQAVVVGKPVGAHSLHLAI